MIRNIVNSIKNLVKFGLVSLVGKDNGIYNTTQATYFEKTKNIIVMMPYGLDANLPKDSLLVLLNIQGNEECVVGFGNLPEKRFKNLKEGEVVVGNPLTTSKIFFDKDGNITIESTGKVYINGSSEPIIKGTAFQTLFNAHTHPDPSSGSTGVPTQQMTATELSTKNFTG